MTECLGRVAGGVLALVVALAPAAGAETITGLKAAEPQPSAQQLAPGLAVQYTYAIVNHVDELKGRKFEAGPPLAHLEWKMGTSLVLTSKSREGVGALISGFLLFEKPGTYGFGSPPTTASAWRSGGSSSTRTRGSTPTRPRTASTSRSIGRAGIRSRSSTSRSATPPP
jgi:hypothetical protein